ncbi:MAG: hypothetical protein PHR64_00540 [Candidatus Shapirobacteria bacterium]|nr:hypothetical protein [Candidatus Shapirobacteria bacterium]MDD5481425.1 hypothetical protein [Candidatus Shapirobacteria bacterium]
MKPFFFLEKIETKTKNWSAPLLVLLFIVLLLRLPSLFEPFWYGDEGIYLTLGQSVRQGQTLYRDIHDNKPPLLYWLAGVAGTVFWFRFILLAWMMGTTVAFFRLVQKFFQSSKPVILLTTIFVFLTSLPLFEGTITNAEHFFIGLVILGVYFFLEEKFWQSGLIMGLAFLFKSPPLFDWLALIIVSFLPAGFGSGKKNFLVKVKEILPLVIGFFIPTLLTFILYALRSGALFYYWESAWLQNLPYLSSWGGQEKTVFWSNQLFWRGIILAIILVGVFLKRKFFLRKKLFFLALLWLVFAIFGAFLSSRPYPHYLLQVVAPLLVVLGFLPSFFKKKKLYGYFLAGLVPVVLLAAGFFYYHFYTHRVIAYYQNFAQFALGQKEKEAYFNWFDSNTWRNYQVVEFINDILPWGEKIFVWGNEPHLYALSRRVPVGRYTVAYHIRDFDRHQEVLTAITGNPPKIVVYDRGYRYSFDKLLVFLNRNYQQVEQFGSLEIWYRLH